MVGDTITDRSELTRLVLLARRSGHKQRNAEMLARGVLDGLDGVTVDDATADNLICQAYSTVPWERCRHWGSSDNGEMVYLAAYEAAADHAATIMGTPIARGAPPISCVLPLPGATDFFGPGANTRNISELG